jgi:DNA-binding HxlR family transcriptional regulator
MKEQEMIEALRANQPFDGLPNVRVAMTDLKPPKPFDIEFDLKFSDTLVTVYAELKSACTPKEIEQIAPWLSNLKEAKSGAAYALICPYISPQVQAICDENKIDFIDLAGNISISVPGKFLLRRTGRKNTTKTRLSFYRDPFSGKSSRVLRVLLEKPGQWTLTKIAEELESERQRNPALNDDFEISMASISRTLKSLEEELLVRKRDVILVPEPTRLLFRWADKYKERYRSYLRRSFKSANRFGPDVRAVTTGLKSLIAPTSFAFTGAAATQITAPFVDVSTIDLFVSNQSEADKIRTLGAGPNLGPDLRIISPYDLGVFMYRQIFEGVPLVSDIQTYLDLSAQGGRDLKQADYLLQNKIEPRWSAN